MGIIRRRWTMWPARLDGNTPIPLHRAVFARGISQGVERSWFSAINLLAEALKWGPYAATWIMNYLAEKAHRRDKGRAPQAHREGIEAEALLMAFGSKLGFITFNCAAPDKQPDVVFRFVTWWELFSALCNIETPCYIMVCSRLLLR